MGHFWERSIPVTGFVLAACCLLVFEVAEVGTLPGSKKLYGSSPMRLQCGWCHLGF